MWIPKGEAVLVDELGAKALVTFPALEAGVIVEIGGRRNKMEARSLESYLFAPGQAGELCAAISRAVVDSGSAEIMEAFNAGLHGEASDV